jgi:DNA-binding NtrC family response regulator
MSAWLQPEFTGRHIVVADEDRRMVDMIIRTLRDDGHAVFHAYDVLSATQLALAIENCDLVISNTNVEGCRRHRAHPAPSQTASRPAHPLSRQPRSVHPELEAQLPSDVPILHEPFTVEDIRRTVAAMLDGKPR